MPDQPHNPFPILEGDHDTVSDLRTRGRWIEDAYGERAWVADDAPSKNEFFGLAATSKRLLIFFGGLIAVMCVLFGRVSYLVAHESKFRALAEGNRLRTVSVPASRGVVYDRNGVQLVANVTDLKLAVVPADLPSDEGKRAAAVDRISKAAGIAADDLTATLAEYGAREFQPVLVADSITRERAVALTIAAVDTPAIRILSGAHRQYTLSNVTQSFSHIIGYMGKITKKDLISGSDYTATDTVGKTGLELSYEQELHGTPGISRVEVDAVGNELRSVSSTDPQPGVNMKLSIDADLMAVSERSLSSIMRRNGLHRGAVVIEDVHTGELLALVSLPSYSDNRFAEGISRDEYAALANDTNHPLFPRATSGTYPSGSTIKLVVAAAALTEKIVTPATTVLSTGGIRYANRYWFPDWKAGGHGYTNVVKALAESVNTFFYMVGGGYQDFQGLGIDRLDKHFQAFGIGHILGIDLPNEASGLLPTPDEKKQSTGQDWFIGDTYHISIGQGDLLVTPLHVAAWTVAVANGGTVWRPHVARSLVAPDGTETAIPPQTLGTPPVTPDSLAVVRQGMRAAVTVGSARGIGEVGTKVAGKTGTAQWNSKKANHAWFTGFAPYDDPQIAVTVLLEEGGEGSSVAVPVAHDIFAWWATHRLNAQPQPLTAPAH